MVQKGKKNKPTTQKLSCHGEVLFVANTSFCESCPQAQPSQVNDNPAISRARGMTPEIFLSHSTVLLLIHLHNSPPLPSPAVFLSLTQLHKRKQSSLQFRIYRALCEAQLSPTDDAMKSGCHCPMRQSRHPSIRYSTFIISVSFALARR